MLPQSHGPCSSFKERGESEKERSPAGEERPQRSCRGEIEHARLQGEEDEELLFSRKAHRTKKGSGKGDTLSRGGEGL